MAYEEFRSTWDKRYKQRHYSYRDSHSVATSVLTALQELGLLAAASPLVLYTFGTNARAISLYNWPRSGDLTALPGPPAFPCYAREVEVYVTEDTWVRFISLNPRYIPLVVLGHTVAQIAALVPAISTTITEVEHFCPTNSMRTFYPTYGVAIVFRADSAAGTIYITAEGNVEGSE